MSEAELARLSNQIAANPEAIEPLFARATLNAKLGRVEAAQQDYLAVLQRAPTHFGALNDLGTLLYNAGFRSAARTAYAEAIAHHPDNPIARINLGNLLLAEGIPEQARAQYETALALAPDHPDAHQGMANLLQDQGAYDEAEQHRQHSYRGRGIVTLPYRGTGQPRRLLQLVSALGGNIPTRFLLDDTRFATSVLVVESYRRGAALPPHDLIFNAIGDADLCAAALDAAASIIAKNTAPVINRPSAVHATGRVANAQRLAGVVDVVAPRMTMLPRALLMSDEATTALATHGFALPVLLRSPGFHTGRNFVRVETAAALADAAATLPGEALLVIEFLEAAGADGLTRKYRMMIVDGRLYPMHLALSRDWKVHYFTAAMEDAVHRDEEARFLADMAGTLGLRAMAGLARIRDSLGLDYGGIDFALSPQGEVLFFEANATMVVNPPDADKCWAYRRAPVQRILDAVQRMLTERT